MPSGVESAGVELSRNPPNDSMEETDVPMDTLISGAQPHANGPLKPESKPSLLDAFQAKQAGHAIGRQSPSDSTPGISGDINEKLVLGSTSEETDDDDSLLDSDSARSEEDEMPFYGLPIKELPTGLCYDDRMRYHAEVASTSENSLHPEDPRRIFYIFKELSEAGLVADPMHARPLVPQPLLRIDAREATEAECCLVHTTDHYAFVRATAEATDEQLIELSESPRMDSIYFNRLSFFSAKLSVGGAIETCRAVVKRKVKNAIAVIRPPGHHAEVSKTMGFCLFNNVCIASRVCQNDFGLQCRKILILDWDVHHGNGCQGAFYDDPNILYVSIHVHMDGKFYPSGQEGDMFHCGTGAGLGFNVNIPWPTKGMGDGDYMFAFQQVVMPIAYEFNPDFVIVAAGFDAAAGDELGGCFVTPACYAHMTSMLSHLADGKIAICLEGGYNFRSISKSALAVTRTLMGEPPDRLDPTAATPQAVDTVQAVKLIQSRYWRSMYPKDPVEGISGGDRLHDIIREWQAMSLYRDYKLTNVHIFRDEVSRSFKDQVLTTPGREDKKNLLVIFHDPPDFVGKPHPSTNKIELQNSWLVDNTKGYIQWAIDHDIGVLDVNIPEHITMDNGSTIRFDSNADQARREAEKLATYLWENYIEPYDHDQVFFIGIGNAFHGVVKLLTEKEEVYQRVGGVVAFIGNNPVRPVHSTDNPYLSRWYIANSIVFVSYTHSLWSGDRKTSKRYGKLQKSPEKQLHDMVARHRDETFAFIEARAKPAGPKSETASEGDLVSKEDIVMSLEK